MVKFNFVLALFLAVYLLQVSFDLWTERLNIAHLKRQGTQVPKPFEGFIDAARLSQITAYTLEKSRMGFFHDALSQFVLLLLIISGFLVSLDRLITSWNIHPIPAGLLFFLIPGTVFYILDL